MLTLNKYLDILLQGSTVAVFNEIKMSRSMSMEINIHTKTIVYGLLNLKEIQL